MDIVKDNLPTGPFVSAETDENRAAWHAANSYVLARMHDIKQYLWEHSVELGFGGLEARIVLCIGDTLGTAYTAGIDEKPAEPLEIRDRDAAMYAHFQRNAKAWEAFAGRTLICMQCRADISLGLELNGLNHVEQCGQCRTRYCIDASNAEQFVSISRVCHPLSRTQFIAYLR